MKRMVAFPQSTCASRSDAGPSPPESHHLPFLSRPVPSFQISAIKIPVLKAHSIHALLPKRLSCRTDPSLRQPPAHPSPNFPGGKISHPSRRQKNQDWTAALVKRLPYLALLQPNDGRPIIHITSAYGSASDLARRCAIGAVGETSRSAFLLCSYSSGKSSILFSEECKPRRPMNSSSPFVRSFVLQNVEAQHLPRAERSKYPQLTDDGQFAFGDLVLDASHNGELDDRMEETIVNAMVSLPVSILPIGV
jgi:hypothetical protein